MNYYHIGENMEEIIIEKMSSNEQLNELFSNDELQTFLSILCSDASDQKRQDEFIKLIKGEVITPKRINTYLFTDGFLAINLERIVIVIDMKQSTIGEMPVPKIGILQDGQTEWKLGTLA